jgi:ABC-type transporter Mla subunit MlaD
MADYRRNEIVSGVFVVAAVGVFALFAFRVGNVDVIAELFARRGLVCRAHFSEVRTLEVGAEVAIAGERVGSVTGIEIDQMPVTREEIVRLQDTYGPETFEGLEPGMQQAKVRVEFELTDGQVRFDRDTARVALVQDGFLGRHFLSFYPGHWTEGAAPPPAAEMPRDQPVPIKVVEVGDLGRLISSAAPVVREVDNLLKQLRVKVFDDTGLESLHTALVELAAALTELGDLLVLRPLQSFLTSTDRSLNDPAEGLLMRATDMLDRGPALVGEAQRAMTAAADAIEVNRDNLQRMLQGLADATADLGAQLQSIEEQATGLLQDSRGVLAENRPEVAEAVRRLRRTMWEAEMAARKIKASPAYLLFGDTEPDLDEQARDLSRTWRSGRAGPYRQRDEGDGK